MKSSLFSRSAAFGAVVMLSMVSFSCNDSGNAGYGPDFNPTASTMGTPSTNLGNATDNALGGLGLGQHTLDTATTAIKNGESDTATPVLNSSQFAATADPGRGGAGLGGSKVNPGGTGSSDAGGSVSFGGTTRSAGGSGSGGSGAGAGSMGGNIASLGDTRTSALVDPSKSGPNGDGSMSAADALGRTNSSDGLAIYGAGGGGAGKSAGGGINPFSGLFGDSNGNGANGSGSTSTEFRRDPASLAGQGDANRNGLGPMGTQDPANYFTMLKADDNLFKIVERRYVSKSKQWAVSDAQQIRRSVQP
ncbi:MAG: hypothetical protein ACJ763_11965 [Bdellovibrionia bacterium]